MSKKKIFIAVIISFVIWGFFNTKTGQDIFSYVVPTKPVKIVFVGDIMLSRQIGKLINAPAASPDYPFGLIKEYVKEADIAFGNLENPVSTRGANQGSIYSFRAHPDTLGRLVMAGFDVVSIANNHMFDWGSDAFLDTITHLDKSKIAHVGGGSDYSEAHAPARFRKGGQEICILGYSQFFWQRDELDSRPAMAGLKEGVIKSDITTARETDCDAVIVSIHWGNEYETEASLPQKLLARSLIDQGAVMVVGHHPHVIQEVEKYKDGLIVYSLGNFIFDQNFDAYGGLTKEGLMLEVSLLDGKITETKKRVIRFSKVFEPYIE